jgi:hypothetical protein
MENSPETVGCYKNCDICVLRSGKAKKNDPPIPADLAPISGSGKRPRPAEEKKESAFLEPVKFRYSTESLVEEQPAAPAEEQQPEHKQRRSKSNRSRKHREEHPESRAEEAPKAEHPKSEKQDKPRPPRKPRPEKKAEAAEGTAQPRADAAPKGEEGHDRARRSRPYYHNRRRRPKGDAPSAE